MGAGAGTEAAVYTAVSFASQSEVEAVLKDMPVAMRSKLNEALKMAQVPSQEAAIRAIGPVLLERGTVHAKTGIAFLKRATAGETMETIFDGKVETVNTAKDGDWVVRANTTAKERFFLPDAKFQRLYKQTPVPYADHTDAAELEAEGFQAYEPCGRVLALKVDTALLAKHLPEGKFLAAWGSEMLVEDGDFLCAPAPPGETGPPASVNEIYRIEKTAFAQTYALEAVGS